MDLLKSHTERDGRTVVLVTHDLRSAAYGDRLITLRDGQVVDEVQSPRASVSYIYIGPPRARDA